ncbi:major facilitator superfamily domain-containing protein [Scleroderma yunnanense]
MVLAPESKHMDAPKVLSVPRIATLVGSTIIALCSGTNYVPYAPQLGARLRISHTQVNVVGLAGSFGVYVSGPIWGRIVDVQGPRIPLTGAFVCLLVGYTGIKRIYDDGIGPGTSISPVHFAVLIICALLTGLGAVGGLQSALSTTAKSFPQSAHAMTTSFVLSGFGLSAFFFSTLAHTFFAGDTSALLNLLALATSIPMLVALFVMRPIPLPSTRPGSMTEAVPSREAIPFIPELDIDSVRVAEEDSRVPLLGDRSGSGNYRVGQSSSAVEIGHVEDGDQPWTDKQPNVHGIQLFMTPDFYLILTIMSLLSGTGLMYINNVGSISLALFAKSNPDYDQVEASKWQAAQVSTLSVGNFAGRIISGLISDFIRTKLHLPRAYSLCVVSSFFIISQVFAISVSSVSALWFASILLGLAYGSLFGATPAILIEWFGLAHLSENWGYLCMAPLVGGNLFSIMFGRNLDAHTPSADPDMSPGAGHGLTVLRWLISRDVPTERQCLAGRECYISSLQVTLMVCIVALALSTWAGIRDRRRNEAKKGMMGSLE